MKRSEERLYTNTVKQLSQILEAEINFDAVVRQTGQRKVRR